MIVLLVNTNDALGGAARLTRLLFQGLIRQGHTPYLAAGLKISGDAHVLEVQNDRYRNPWARIWYGAERRILMRRGTSPVSRMAHYIGRLGEPRRLVDRRRGLEDFCFPGTSRIFDGIPGGVDILHLHNLHGEYFDLRELPRISRVFPTVWTLHDEWSFTGHCASPLGCELWKTGCQSCPDIGIHPSIQRDAAALNWKRKREIFRCSRLFLVTPSNWLMDRAKHSVLWPAVVKSRVIHNSVDLDVFHVGDKMEAREALGLPGNSRILLFAGQRTRNNPFKDYETMESAVARAASGPDGENILFLCLGEAGGEKRVERASIRFLGYQEDPEVMARYYRAADIYLHAALAEVWGLSITEALACGTPVIATAVGGIPEQLRDLFVDGFGRRRDAAQRKQCGPDAATGILVPRGDSLGMSRAIKILLEDERLLKQLGQNAARDARVRFSAEKMLDGYGGLYREILRMKPARKKAVGHAFSPR